MNTPFLSIGIPTYNRAALLREALEAIATQLDATFGPQVEIIVSDNASTDETQAIVKQLVSSYPSLYLVYFRQSENLGADANVNTLLKMATGEFVYLLSDDDILLPGAVATVFSLLRGDPTLDALCLNMQSFERSLDEANPPNIPTDGDHLYRSRNNALVYLNTYLTFISALVFRRALIADRDYAVRIGTNFPQAYAFLDVLAHDGGMFATQQPYLATRSNNTGGYNFFRVFVTHFAEVLNYAETIGYAPSATRRVLVLHRQFVFNFVKVFKLRSSFGTLTPDYRDALRRILHVYWRQPLFLAQIIPLMLLPRALVPMVYQITKLTRRMRS